MVDAQECVRRWPIIDGSQLVGGYVTEGEGLAVALRAVEAQARRAVGRGARFVGDTTVTGIEHHDGHVTGVRVGEDVIDADVVVCCAGVWGPTIADMVGLALPMLALEHQYVITSPVPELAANADREATMPIVRHHDAGLYFRDHGDRVGIGSFNHRRLPVSPEELDTHARREEGVVYSFTAEDFAEPWDLTCELMPALAGLPARAVLQRGVRVHARRLPADRGTSRLARVLGRRIGVGDAFGRCGRVLAETLIDGAPTIDASPAELSRFERPELDPSVFEARCDDSYRDVYEVHHPAEGHTQRARSAVQPVRATSARAGCGVLRRRGVGAPALVRVERTPGRCRDGPGQGRVEFAPLVADRDRRTPRGARTSRPVRHDRAHQDRGRRRGGGGVPRLDRRGAAATDPWVPSRTP